MIDGWPFLSPFAKDRRINTPTPTNQPTNQPTTNATPNTKNQHRNISAVPIVDEGGRVIDLYHRADVTLCVENTY